MKKIFIQILKNRVIIFLNSLLAHRVKFNRISRHSMFDEFKIQKGESEKSKAQVLHGSSRWGGRTILDLLACGLSGGAFTVAGAGLAGGVAGEFTVGARRWHCHCQFYIF